LAKPPAKKRPHPEAATRSHPEPAAGPSAKAAGKQCNPNPPTPPPAKDPSPIQKITSAIKKKNLSITVHGSHKALPAITNTLPHP